MYIFRLEYVQHREEISARIFRDESTRNHFRKNVIEI